jgi:hypothetical protein
VSRWLAAASGVLCAFLVLAPSSAGAALRSDFELGGQWKLNSAARLMAGLSPMHPGHFDFAQSAAWKEHSAAMTSGWAILRASRVAAMESFRNESISRTCPVGKTLLYPFSGPDFLNAYWLFPECETFVMFGLEHIGDVPNLDAMNERDLTRLMGDVRAATADLFQRNYFITENMTRQLHTPQLRGVVPLFMISMAMSGVEILRMVPHELGPVAAGEPLAEPDAAVEAVSSKRSLRKPRGMQIEFRAPGSAVVRRVVYYTVDVSDSSMARYPEFLAFLRKTGPTTTLLKSASYLLHAREFSRLRSTLLGVSQFLVQDDSGLPYKTLVSRGWEFRLHGTYAVPIPPFEGAFQPTLQAAYRKQSPEPLPFDFGYHYSDRRDQRANVMIGRKIESHGSFTRVASAGRASPGRMQIKTTGVGLR